MSRVLTINDDVLFKVKIEGINQLKDSFFKPEYIQALNELKSIIDNSKFGSYEDFNNIIAFVGERGTGKTSVMLSFKEAICNSNSLEIKQPDELGEKLFELKDKKWEYIDLVDPSILSNKDSIIEVVIGNMFKKFKEYNGNKDFNQKQNLVKSFEVVYKNLKVINKTSKYKDNEDSLEKLLDLSSAVDLKSNIVIRHIISTKIPI